MHALILNNKVVDISSTPFEVAKPLEWVLCEDTVKSGMKYIDGVFSDNAEEVIQTLSEADFEKSLDNFLDNTARKYRWDNRFTFVARAAYPNAWQSQAIAFGEWMDACNLQAYNLLEEVKNNTKPAPSSINDFLNIFPEFILP